MPIYNPPMAPTSWRIGMPFSWPTEEIPTFSLLCDGSEISRSAYAQLFRVLGTRYGEGDGQSTFNIPDYRGEFLRGWSNGSGKDPDANSRLGGDTVGSSQSSQVISHRHALYGIPRSEIGEQGTLLGEAFYDRLLVTRGSDPYYVSFNGGAETRSRNIAVAICIWYA